MNKFTSIVYCLLFSFAIHAELQDFSGEYNGIVHFNNPEEKICRVEFFINQKETKLYLSARRMVCNGKPTYYISTGVTYDIVKENEILLLHYKNVQAGYIEGVELLAYSPLEPWKFQMNFKEGRYYYEDKHANEKIYSGGYVSKLE